jgi:uncharacterized protein YecT (DUF1311 family)
VDLRFFAKLKGGVERSFWLGALVLAAGPGVAQDLCADESCIGDMARACWADDVSRAGVCLGEELGHWGQRFDAVRQALIEDGAAIEDVNASTRAIVSFRTVTCSGEDAVLRGISESGEDWAECMIDMTAPHVLTLEQILEERQ